MYLQCPHYALKSVHVDLAMLVETIVVYPLTVHADLVITLNMYVQYTMWMCVRIHTTLIINSEVYPSVIYLLAYPHYIQDV